MPIRRHCDPINVKHIWDAIRSINHLSQKADLARVTRYLQKSLECSPAQADLYIKQALKDNLIVNIRKSGPTDTSFKAAPQELPEFDGKDWYCFECHLAGDVVACKNCFRVFHPDCIPQQRRKFEAQKIHFNRLEEHGLNSDTSSNDSQSLVVKSLKDYIYDESLCIACNIANIDDQQLEKAEMNYLLKFVLLRIRSWLPNTLTHTMAAEERPEWLTDTELTWRANQLFFEHRDMSVIEVNLNTETYNALSDFFGDILTVQHNVAIFHGIDSQEYEASVLLLQDTIHDLAELKNCVDCYKHSNEKINSWWYCLPCRTPHALMWAKQKGYPYWPAKVIKETATHFDVRFFGGSHERALLVKSLVKPISVKKESLHIKSSSAFVKAYEELQYHQKLLSDPQELESLKANITNKKRLSKPMDLISPIAKNKTPKQKQKKKLSKLSNTPTEENSVDELEKNETSPNVQRKRSITESEPVAAPIEKRSKSMEEKNSTEISGNVIDISDGEEEESMEMEYSFRENTTVPETFRPEETYEQVTSSTEPSHDTRMQKLDQPYSDSVEKMRRKLEELTNKKDIIKCAMDCMQTEVDQITNDHNDHLKRLFESHNAQISETKKKQWCYNCEQDAIYHCCWNTAYCSQTCQQQHWQAEHKKVCRRKQVMK